MLHPGPIILPSNAKIGELFKQARELKRQKFIYAPTGRSIGWCTLSYLHDSTLESITCIDLLTSGLIWVQ